MYVLQNPYSKIKQSHLAHLRTQWHRIENKCPNPWVIKTDNLTCKDFKIIEVFGREKLCLKVMQKTAVRCQSIKLQVNLYIRLIIYTYKVCKYRIGVLSTRYDQL